MIIKLRPATDGERFGYVRSTWLTSVLPERRHVPAAGTLPAPRKGHRVGYVLARKALELLVDHLLEDPATVVIVAELDSVPGEVLGWIAFDGRAVHFVRVPAPYARKGLGRALLAQAGDLPASYSTAAGDALAAAVSCTRKSA